MSLSPYINPTAINGVMNSTSKLGGLIYPDGLDKRSTGFLENLRNTATNIVDTTQDVADSIANLAGSRSPMYIIGEIPAEETQDIVESEYIPDMLSGLVRAVSSTFAGNTQNGVIIDGLGNIDGTFAVEFMTNPAFYKTNNIVDQRYRVPTKLTMVVLVSDYLDDDLISTTMSAVSALDPTGIVSNVKNILAYGGLTRSQYALTKLRYLMENAMPFTVYTPHGVYENMLIKSLKPKTDADKMSMLYCTVEFQEVLYYMPYSNTPGNIPARRGVNEVTPGWTTTAVEKIRSWL